MILFVWVYCLIWFVIQDICKVGLYKLMYCTGFSVVNQQSDQEHKKKDMQRATRSSSGIITSAFYTDGSHQLSTGEPKVGETEQLTRHIVHLENVVANLLEKVYGDGQIPKELAAP